MKVLSCCVACLALLGCANNPPAPEIKTKYVIIAPEDDKLKDAVITTPPNEQQYAAQTDPKEKERMLFAWGESLTQALGEVNRRLKSIRNDVADARAVYGSQAK